jgi:hypothetical protein
MSGEERDRLKRELLRQHPDLAARLRDIAAVDSSTGPYPKAIPRAGR